METETVFRCAITVEVPIEEAFEVFTAGFDTWWPRPHHIGSAELAEAVLEPRMGGRWFERGVDGSECEWGRVLTWDPPHHVAVSWQIDADFRFEPDPDRASRVDVRFTAQDEETTRVELAHSGLERHGAEWRRLYASISSPGGWHTILAGYGETATASARRSTP